MFGFVRPYQDELKVIEYKRFKTIYCGLCNAIYKRYGIFYTNFLSYDISYYALVLGSLSENVNFCNRRCTASPFKKKIMEESPQLDMAADVSILLSYYKVLDTINDEKGIKRLSACVLKFLMKPAYRKAHKRQTIASDIIKESLDNLAVFEKANESSIDKIADVFATMLAKLALINNEDNIALREIFYHMGRWIYIIDAIYDLKEDFKENKFNPLILRYKLKEAKLNEEAKDSLRISLGNSIDSVQKAIELLDIKKDKEILDNIGYIALGKVTMEVLEGTYKNMGGKINE